MDHPKLSVRMHPFFLRLKKTFVGGLTWFVAVVLLFEEWGWEPLAALFARLARLPVWSWVERRIQKLPPWAALLVFFVPVLLLLPIKLLALYLFGTGRVTLGLLLLVGAKLLGTALAARLFKLTQPALLQLCWFAKLYGRWKGWKDQLLARVRQTAPWRAVQATRQRVKAWWGG